MSKKKIISVIVTVVGVALLSTLVYGRVIKHTSGPMNASMGNPEE